MSQEFIKSYYKSITKRLTIKSQVFEGEKTKKISEPTAAFDKQHSSAGDE